MLIKDINAWKAYFGIPANFKLACIRQSKAAHDVYKKIAFPMHGCYFGVHAVVEHGVIAYLSGGLLLLLITAWFIEEHAP